MADFAKKFKQDTKTYGGHHGGQGGELYGQMSYSPPQNILNKTSKTSPVVPVAWFPFLKK